MNFANILHSEMINGDGLGVSLYPCGCSIHCKGCFNRELWNRDYGLPYTQEEENEIMQALEKDYHTRFSVVGGHAFEPYNLVIITKLLKKIKEKFKNKIQIWVYTGLLWTDVMDKKIMQYIDVLIDGRFIEELKDNTENCKWCGSSNQRVIDVKKSLKSGEVILYDNAN